MKSSELISDEQLNAFLDNELDDKERAHILEAIRQDKEISVRFCDLSQIKNMVSLAYKNPPQPKQKNYTSAAMGRRESGLRVAFASLALILFGGLCGWVVSTQLLNQEDSTFQTVSQIKPGLLKSKKILLHINSMDNTRVQATLETAKKLLNFNGSNGKNRLELEIVANADGLGILRLNSPYSNQIKSLASQYNNVTFMACGIAKQNARLKEGKEIELIPEAQDIPAALDQILKRIKDGWTYVRG
ncbi:MAG: hypothetical protein GXP19_07920 [Gammaproteobacteria bacterium]|nr:hypothetical protein [Gammaproteobacteria bacterium]